MYPWPDNGPREFCRIDHRELEWIVIHCTTLIHGRKHMKVYIPRFQIHVNKQSSTVTLMEPEVISTLKRANLLVDHYMEQMPECIVGSVIMVRDPQHAYHPQIEGHHLEYDLLINAGRPNRMRVVCARASNGYAWVTSETIQPRQWPGMELRFPSDDMLRYINQ
jgi:hypothetical protein